MAHIEFRDVTKKFGNNVVIENLNLDIEQGKFTVLVGPSGCGKTTLLRMLAGIGPQTSGRVLIDGQDVTDIPPGKRGVAMVFQNYAIYPTMNVRANIEFGLKNSKVPKDKREKLIKEIGEVVGLTPYLERKPSELSGGQRQRVALARAMVKQPNVFLMDEPLSNLDAKLRVQMRIELIELHKRLEATFVYVTHDQVEAMSMADNIVLMNEGIIQQNASPEVIYHKPTNLFTAQFIGTPPMNVMQLDNDEIKTCYRPEKARLEVSKVSSEQAISFGGRIVTREMLGSETIYSVRHKGGLHMIKSTDEGFKVDQDIFISVNKKDVFLFGKDDNRISEDTSEYKNYIGRIGSASL